MNAYNRLLRAILKRLENETVLEVIHQTLYGRNHLNYPVDVQNAIEAVMDQMMLRFEREHDMARIEIEMGAIALVLLSYYDILTTPEECDSLTPREDIIARRLLTGWRLPHNHEEEHPDRWEACGDHAEVFNEFGDFLFPATDFSSPYPYEYDDSDCPPECDSSEYHDWDE